MKKNKEDRHIVGYGLSSMFAFWRKFTHVIGAIILTALLAVIYVLVFGIVGIVLRLIKKDLLCLKEDRSRGSYWVRRKTGEFKPQNYLRQF